MVERAKRVMTLITFMGLSALCGVLGIISKKEAQAADGGGCNCICSCDSCYCSGG